MLTGVSEPRYVQKAHPGEDLVVCAREEAKADNSMVAWHHPVLSLWVQE